MTLGEEKTIAAIVSHYVERETRARGGGGG